MSPIGLDLYLTAKKYVPSYSNSNDVGADAEAARQFNRVLEAADLGSIAMSPGETRITSLTVEFQVGYWRKANQVLAWFERAFGEMENCKHYDVSREQLIELADTCLRVLGDHDLARRLLPTQEGFFYGSQEFDSSYFWDLEHTAKLVESIIDNPELSGPDVDFQFHAWW